MLKLPRSLRFLLILILALLAAYLFWRIFFLQALVVPVKFLEANRQGVVIAEKIVDLSRESADRIATISKLEKENKVAEAVDLVERELARNRDIRQQAMMLSSELQVMTESLAEIKPESVRAQALEAISIEVSLTNRLFDYNDYLNQLLNVLKDKFLYNISPVRGKIDDLITKINGEAKAIHELNLQFNSQIQNIFS